jgi:hypothetical protein
MVMTNVCDITGKVSRLEGRLIYRKMPPHRYVDLESTAVDAAYIGTERLVPIELRSVHSWLGGRRSRRLGRGKHLSLVSLRVQPSYVGPSVRSQRE